MPISLPTKPHRTSVLAGLIGRGISRSRSPDIHQGEAIALGFPLTYRLIDAAASDFGAEDLPALLRWAEAMGFDGLNVTLPFKQSVLPLIDVLSDEADALQTVNSIIFRDGKRYGDNTDWSGYTASFLSGLGEYRRGIVGMVGAGGAASAVGYAHLRLGASVLRIYDPAEDRALALSKRLGELFPEAQVAAVSSVAAALDGAEGVVQASPVGGPNYPGLPFDPILLKPEMWVSEVIYVPARTALVEAAAAIGCPTLGGGGMAVMQAADAFRLFTGLEPDVARTLRAFEAASA